MEEADLLRERLQAITDKRRIQEDIARKRRQIEEEKLKLQYIKKKALRDQWLMDGVSQQSEEEQEATRLQAQDEQQQSHTLQSNIHRMEKEIQALETQELNISANEEAVLKRLKEVERTAEDIIKELKDKSVAVPDGSSFVPVPVCQPAEDEPMRVALALEISVQQDLRTGTLAVVSSAPLDGGFKPGGLKVYEDGCRSVFLLPPEGTAAPPGGGDMSPAQLEDLLHQASLKPQVRLHQPVYSAVYTGPSRPETQNPPGQTATPCPSCRTGAQVQTGGNHNDQDKETLKIPSPSFLHPDHTSEHQRRAGQDQPPLHQSPGESSSPGTRASGPACSPTMAALVALTAKPEGLPAPRPAPRLAVLREGGGQSPSTASSGSEVDPEVYTKIPGDFNRPLPSCAGSVSPLNLVRALPDRLESEPVTMVFLGYQNAVDQNQDIQAELVVVGNSDEEDEAVGTDGGPVDELSYHPQGYRSKVFLPRVGLAHVQDPGPQCEDLWAQEPTFVHKAGESSTYQSRVQNQSQDQSQNQS